MGVSFFYLDLSEEVFEEIHHPKSHLTLGQFRNCRIPVSSPLTPYQFVSFILRNFYNTAHRNCLNGITHSEGTFSDTIADLERGIVHVQIPS